MNSTQVRHNRYTKLPLTGQGGRMPAGAMLLMVLSAVLFMPGCSGPKTSDRDLVMVDVEQARELAERGGRTRLGRTQQVVWVDPRTPREFRQERIPGAILMPLDRARDEHRALREYDVLIVYGNEFNSPRATALSKILIESGHSDVRTLRGGLQAWNAAGQPTESGD